MKLKENCIDTIITLKGFGEVKVTNDMGRFEMYKDLGLDVFATEIKAPKPTKKANKEIAKDESE